MTKVAELSSDLATLTAEINAYKRVAGEAIFEIGRRLRKVKEEKLAEKQGEGWLKWCESLEFTRQTADKFIQAFEQFGDVRDVAHIQMGKVFEMIQLPYNIDRQEFIENPHTVPSTGQTKTVEDMTVRELREVKAALKAEEKARKEAEMRAQKALERAEVAKDMLRSNREQTKTEYVPDPWISDRLKRYEARYGDIDGTVTERVSNHIEVDGAAEQFADDVQTLLLNYAHLTTFKASFTGISDEAYENYVTSLDALKEFINGMQRVLDGAPRGKTEVIDI
ncbi:hypothetical protein B7C51_06930 [Paenibacillus larvae subsp. pulvifaciens]|uniref:DUF3102 domain-containing protein n=1 Tax=Paenibacillus larvae subsp. pulvifaciens TaxID=1477 RepID=A0A1V0URM1_9BACL|nr:DUF3102 domain-containing protein [Paenibacillus larvae]ARF67622.1 hypothetical protein B7C51_06930 [Paenibacillus larvae subsp. pulvifaciens]